MQHLCIGHALAKTPVTFREMRKQGWLSPSVSHISAAGLFAGQIRAKSRLSEPQRAPKGNLSVTRKRAIEKRLISMAESSEGAVSILELATRLEVSRSCLKYFWPDLCNRISTAYLARRKAEAKARLAQRCQKLEAIMDALVAQGIYPSQRAMNKALAGSDASMLDPTVRALYRRRLAEFARVQMLDSKSR